MTPSICMHLHIISYTYTIMHTLVVSNRFGYQIQDQIATWLETSSYVTQNDRILDIGCGNGALLTELVNCRIATGLGMP